MASSYFTLPSFARAKKNKEELEKTNPKEPVLKDEDEKFFDKEMRSGSTSAAAKEAPATKITDDGEEKPVTQEEKEEAVVSDDQAVIPDNRPDSGIAQADESAPDDAQKSDAAPQTDDTSKKDDTPKGDDKPREEDIPVTEEAPTSDDAPKLDQTPEQQDTPEDAEASKEADTAKEADAPQEVDAATVKEHQAKKKAKGMELPSQEEAEAATRGFNSQVPDAAQDEGKPSGEKKTWTSYLPSIRRPQSSGKSEQTPPASAGGEGEQSAEKGDKSGDETQQSRTWTQYASSYVPSIPSFKSKKKADADSTVEPVYNEDGTVNEAATAEKQEREVSVLLDNLNLSSINNRVFSFSAETQHLYERFLQCLKDVINGAPTAYEDMDKLMKEAGPKLEEQWKVMPPFVQTLVKSLPMRLGPEIMAAAAENPNDEMRKNLQNASTQGSSGSAGVAAAAMREGGDAKDDGGKDGEQKQKRKIPGLKSLVSGQGAIATLLRNTVTFIETRFPFLASTTNVVMSLAVFSEYTPLPG